MFRAMKEQADGLPKVGRSSRELGVRIGGPTRDIDVAQVGRSSPVLVPPTLLLRWDRYPHAVVEPSRRCLLPDFEFDLANTRPLSSKTHD